MIIVNHAGDSAIVASRICPRVFLHLGLKFCSSREDFLVEMYILLSLVISGTCGRGEKEGVVKLGIGARSCAQ